MKKYTRNLQKKVVKIKFTKQDSAFIEFVKSECARTGIKCDLRLVKWLRSDGVRCSGYFDESGKKLVVAMNRPDALSILVHEYCHLTQWQDGIELWESAAKSLYKVFKWLDGYTVADVIKHIGIARDLELDNERRSVQMIKRWNLSIDIDSYIKKANAYVMFYNWLHYSRSWSNPKKVSYDSPIVLQVMSNKFNMQYSKMSQKVFNAFNTVKT